MADDPQAPAGRTARRHADPGTTRAVLVEAALATFSRVSVHETDSNRLAREAGYSPGTFYRHFADKRAVFLAAYDRFLETSWGDVEAEALTGLSTERKLARVLARLVERHRESRVFRANVRALVATDEVVRDHVRARRKEQLEHVFRVREQLGATKLARASAAVHLIAVERLCDAIADGELEALGIDEGSARRALGALFADYAVREG